MRLCRVPCGKPLAFRQGDNSFGGSAARGEASPLLMERTESQRLSARDAAKPPKTKTQYPIPKPKAQSSKLKAQDPSPKLKHQCVFRNLTRQNVTYKCQIQDEQ